MSDESNLTPLLCAKSDLISLASRLVMCRVLNEIEEVCEKQDSISTKKLQGIVDRISNKLKDEAVCARNISRKIRT